MPLRLFPALAAVLLIVGCSVPTASVAPSGKLEVLGPAPGFSPTALPGDWALDGGDIDDTVSVVRKDGFPALRIDEGEDAFILARRTRAILLVSPYLSWAWNMQPVGLAPAKGKTPTHPMRLIIGFHGGPPDARSWGSKPLRWTGRRLPPHDRVLTLAWGTSALQRGSFLDAPAADGKSLGTDGKIPRYVVRGGADQADSWRLETVDLSMLYRRLWPGDSLKDVRISFIGVASVPDRNAPLKRTGYISGLVLNR